MADHDENGFKGTHRELHDAMNELRKEQGLDPLPYAPPELEACSFCGKGKNEVRHLISGIGVYICDECVKAAQKKLGKE